ncbi:MAG: ZIP family metal transporter [Candidatus Woesearchaeota archaeon]
MIPVIAQIAIAVGIVSIISLIGALTLILTKKMLDRLIFFLISFAAGALIGTAFLEMLPETVEQLSAETVFVLTLIGTITFFGVETFFYWYHHFHLSHKTAGKHRERTTALPYLNILGDGIHNFLDGAIIATTFLVAYPLGVITTLAVMLHEIPQEIGDFGILVYSGFSRLKALFWNFVSALAAFIGAFAAFFFVEKVANISMLLLPFSAGGFIYIALADLVPEMHHAESVKKAGINFLLFLSGIAVIWLLGILIHV